VIGLLIGGGVALYRLGYGRGIAAAGTLAETGQLPRLYGRGMPGFDEGRIQVWPYGGMMGFGRHMPFGMFGFGGPIVGLLLLAGLVTLIVLGIRALTHKRPVEVQAVSAPVAPAAIESTPARATRGAKRTKTS
jgi:uncharacterized iron-regulated membrane protein